MHLYRCMFNFGKLYKKHITLYMIFGDLVILILLSVIYIIICYCSSFAFSAVQCCVEWSQSVYSFTFPLMGI